MLRAPLAEYIRLIIVHIIVFVAFYPDKVLSLNMLYLQLNLDDFRKTIFINYVILNKIVNYLYYIVSTLVGTV